MMTQAPNQNLSLGPIYKQWEEALGSLVLSVKEDIGGASQLINAVGVKACCHGNSNRQGKQTRSKCLTSKLRPFHLPLVPPPLSPRSRN